MRSILSLILLLGISSSLFGQIESKVVTGLTGLKNIQTIGDIVIGDKESDIKEISLGLVTVKTKASIVEFDASDEQRKPVNFILNSEFRNETDNSRVLTYSVTTQGTVYVEVLCVDFDQKIYNKYRQVINIGPPKPPTPPEPPTPPTPDIPSDVFDNLGQRVAIWTAGQPVNQAVGKVYLEAALELQNNLTTTIDQVTANMLAKVRSIPEYASYTKFKEELNKDRLSRGAMSRGTTVAYWKCIALGLGVKP